MAELEEKVGQLEKDLAELKVDLKDVLVDLKALSLEWQNPLANQNSNRSRPIRDHTVDVVASTEDQAARTA